MSKCFPRWSRIVLLTLTVTILAAGPAASGVSFELSNGSVTVDGERWRGAVSVQADKDGVLQAYVMASLRPGDHGPLMVTRYFNLRRGDILPVYGCLYRVDKIVDLGPSKILLRSGASRAALDVRHDGSITASPVDKEALPPSVALGERCIAVPLGAWTDFMEDGVAVEFKKIEPPSPTDTRGSAAEIEVRGKHCTIWCAGEAPTVVVGIAKAKLRRGDAITIKGRAYTVRNVATPDPKAKLIGWIELDPGPPPPASAKPIGEPLVFRSAPSPLPVDEQHETFLESARTGKDGVVEAYHVIAGPHRPLGEGPIVRYSSLRTGDIVPVFGRLYRVEKIVDLGEPKSVAGKDWMTMMPVEKGDLPPDVTFQERSVVIPIGGSARLLSGRLEVSLRKIEPAAVDDTRGPVAEVTESGVARTSSAEIRQGDLLPAGGPCAVRNIVLPDPKKHVIGWIELDPGPDADRSPKPIEGREKMGR